MPTTNIARVRDLYGAFADGDWATVLACFSEDVAWTQPGTTRLSKVHQGRDAVIEFFWDIASYGLAVRPIEFFGEGDQVVAVVDVALGDERANEVDRFTLREGVITAVEHIGDTAMLSRVVDGATPVRRDEPADREASVDPDLEES